MIRVVRDSTAFQDSKDRIPGHYVSSAPMNRYIPEQWLSIIRNHWGGVEIRNHWRKDACLFEDKTRSRNPTIVAALAMLRNCLLFFFAEQAQTDNLNAYTESLAADSTKAFNLLFRCFK